MTSNKYLLEIGVEELPARLIGSALDQLKSNVEKVLAEERISYGELKAYETPRRLTLIIDGLEEKQEDISEKVKGPSKKIGFDSEGNPTKALQGFMRGQNVNLENIIVEEVKGEEYVYANVVKKGKTIEEIITLNMANVIKDITFPKSMKWGGKNLRFARPIRWIVSILNEKVVPFELEAIPVGRVTKGHRFLGKSIIEIDRVDSYIDLLESNYVIVNQNERKDIIKFGAEKLARERGGNLQEDKGLLEEVTNIVEYPTPMIGRIKEEYLSLPEDVIITPMKEHLRYFPVFNDKGRLLPYFITVRNGNDQHLETVIKGNEKVLGARLEDAKFFYMDDISQPLEAYVPGLEKIVFQEKLGTLYEKVVRLQKLGEKISAELEVGEETERNVNRAAYLSKADLVTKMVGEFSELQGKMGMEYGKKSGENEIVSIALFEQYLPRFAGDILPSTTAGLVLSMTDKIDTICGLYAIGIHPTGSQDPFGLRRQALGIINMILNKKLNISLTNLIDDSLYIYIEEKGLVFDHNKVKEDIVEFFRIRIRTMFIDEGYRYDIVDSVVKGIDNIYDMKIKLEEVSNWLDGDVRETILIFNRISNLAKKTKLDEVKRDLMEAEELNLYDKFNLIEEKVEQSIEKKEFKKALEQLSQLEEPINNFFDTTMVMVDDENVKNNRLGLLRKIYNLMESICDLSEIVSK